MHKAYRFRIYPNKIQRELIHKTLGCSRFVFNHFLAKRKEVYEEKGETLNYAACSSLLTQLKKELEWLREPDATALQSSLRALDDAFKKFFRAGSGYPRFKSRKNPIQSYTSKNNRDTIGIEGNRLRLPKLGWVKFAKSREVEGRVLSATIRRNPTGKYFVSVLCELNSCTYLPVDKSKAIGIDLGLTNFVILSDGTKEKPSRFFRKYEQKLARWQQIISRRIKGSSNWHKAKIKVARIHQKIANARQDFLHKLSTNLIHDTK